jgi:enamine deaminase RidA (YjgF/YER057c/UK114 family)
MDAEGNAVHAGDMAAQIAQSLDNLEEVLRKAEMSLSSLVRLNIYTTDIDQFFAAHEVLAKRLSAAGCQPPGSLLGVARLAFPDLLVELEATAAD